jgi:RNA polymerase sigma-70 factor (ECF subfamily)
VNSARSTYRRLRNQAVASDVLPAEKPDARTTSVIAGTRLDLLDALETLEQDHPQYVEPLLLRDVYGWPTTRSPSRWAHRSGRSRRRSTTDASSSGRC